METLDGQFVVVDVALQARDILKGKCSDPCRCPFALATLRALTERGFKVITLTVGKWHTNFNVSGPDGTLQWYTCDNPVEESAWIERFDTLVSKKKTQARSIFEAITITLTFKKTWFVP